MQILTTVKEVQEYIGLKKSGGKTIGFVPTMGALHMGHISLIETAAKENDIVICSIFVNPKQFNNPADLEKYPRTLEKDAKLLGNYNCDIIFAPSILEVYPEKKNISWDFGLLDKVMEGTHRPGHFNGVATVVKRLFEIVQPHNAYFGEKDYQQLLIIKTLVKRLQMPINIVSCGIVREADGLAMSSRNVHLSPEERENAVNISKALQVAKQMAGKSSIGEVKEYVVNFINNPVMKVEYFEVADADVSIQQAQD